VEYYNLNYLIQKLLQYYKPLQTPDLSIKAIDLCALVGFKSTALDLPIVKITEENESLSESDLNISEVDISDLTKNFISGSKVVESAKRDKLALSEKVYNMQLKDLEDISSLEKGLLIGFSYQLLD